MRIENREKWLTYVEHLILHNEKTDRVWRDNPYPEYYQFPDGKEDIREAIDKRIVRELLMDSLNWLQEREIIVIKNLFGLEDNKPKTLREVGLLLHVGKERVRQVCLKGMRKLRRHFAKACNEKMRKEIINQEEEDDFQCNKTRYERHGDCSWVLRFGRERDPEMDYR